MPLNNYSTRQKAYICLAAVSILWGTTWMASRQGVRFMPALQMAGIRQFVAGALYVSFFIYKGLKWPRGKEWGIVLVLSIINFVFSNGLATWALKYISGGLGSIMAAIFPLFIVIIGIFKPGVKMPTKAVLGLILGFGGVCIIFYEHLHDFLNPDFRLGILLSLSATLSWAFGTLYTKEHAVNFNPYFSIGLQMLISGVILYGMAIFAGKTVPISSVPWQSWTAIAYLVIVGSVIAFIAYLYALQNLPTAQTSIYAYINPIVAVICGSLFFSEKLTSFIMLGGLVALVGVYIVNQVYKKSKAEIPEAEGM